MIARGGRRTLLLMLGLAGLAACSDADERNYADAEASSGSAASENLDALAVETGALPDTAQIDPSGRYGRRYEGGSDSLCVVPDGSARGRYRFGAETRIGGEEYCRGTGHARLSADKLLLRFDGAGSECMIVARYEGDKIVMPGGLDLHCAALCSSRGSFSGVAFPRLDRDVATARGTRDARGQPLCR
ncbi:hypothetical protein [Sphingobium nicotianae]|uniref:Lipoprotein n=1 Tax=Sphingobium nicotianae TaxID=2782607 RepID=A0A9X1DBY9_9SPHN|nr:hypothetical protein [Sphingobium nicotianae]MBT2187118.1 hypothetical protein [Sphingobium nicotianae]